MAGMGETLWAYRVTEEKHEGTKPFGRPRPRLKNNVKMDFKKWDGRH